MKKKPNNQKNTTTELSGKGNSSTEFKGSGQELEVRNLINDPKLDLFDHDQNNRLFRNRLDTVLNDFSNENCIAKFYDLIYIMLKLPYDGIKKENLQLGEQLGKLEEIFPKLSNSFKYDIWNKKGEEYARKLLLAVLNEKASFREYKIIVVCSGKNEIKLRLEDSKTLKEVKEAAIKYLIEKRNLNPEKINGFKFSEKDKILEEDRFIGQYVDSDLVLEEFYFNPLIEKLSNIWSNFFKIGKSLKPEVKSNVDNITSHKNINSEGNRQENQSSPFNPVSSDFFKIPRVDTNSTMTTAGSSSGSKDSKDSEQQANKNYVTMDSKDSGQQVKEPSIEKRTDKVEDEKKELGEINQNKGDIKSTVSGDLKVSILKIEDQEDDSSENLKISA